MSSRLPENIEAELRREFARGAADFRGGVSMPIGSLVLSKDTRIGRFVCCYSSKHFRQNITQAEAEERIAIAKEEVVQLFALFPELAAEVRSLPPVFHFYYGKGAVSVATEEDGQFVYYPHA